MTSVSLAIIKTSSFGFRLEARASSKHIERRIMFPWDSRCIFHPMTTRTEILRVNYKLHNENEMEKNDIRDATSHVRRNFMQVPICFLFAENSKFVQSCG